MEFAAKIASTLKLSYFSQEISFQTPAANAPPARGPRMKIQSCLSASPPWKIAGPIERAGLTEVPV